jgi:hypothetical protein
MASSPKKPNLSSIFSAKKNKSSPAGSLDLPLELPTIQNITEDNITPSSPKKVTDSDIKTFISRKPKYANKDFEKILTQNGFTLSEKYLTSTNVDNHVTTAYYTKVFDKYGTPLYVDLDTYTEPLSLDTNTFNGNMVLIKDVKINSAAINYVVTTSNLSDKLIECGQGSFCVVKYKDDGSATVDKFVIPDSKELEKIKNETQQYVSPDSLIDSENPVTYSIVSFDDISNYKDKITPLRHQDWFTVYQKNINDLQVLSAKNIEYLNTKINDIKIVTGHTISNRALAFEKTNQFKKLQSVNFKETPSNNVTTKIRACNEAIEEYIKLSNNISKLTYESKIIYNSLVENGNKFFNTYTNLQDIISLNK